MKIAVFGSDARAAAIGSLLKRGGYTVAFADVREAWSTQPPDVLVFADGYADMDELIGQAGGLVPESIVIDAMDGPAPADVNVAETLASHLGSQRIVRALVVLPQPGANILCCADDRDAMNVVDGIFRACGCITTYRGSLAHAGELQPPRRTLGQEFETLTATNTIANP